MGRIFDDPCQQARQEFAESADFGEEDDYGYGSSFDEEEESRRILEGEEEAFGEETLTDAECFHYLLYSDCPDGDWEEIHRKVLRGAQPKPSK